MIDVSMQCLSKSSNFPTQIELIEDLPLQISDKFAVLMTFLGKKPASLISIHSYYYREGDSKKYINSSQLALINQTLDRLNLCFSFGTIQEIPSGGDSRQRLCQSQVIYLAQTKDILDTTVSAHTKQPIDHYNLGILLGYPATAVQAFLDQTTINPDDITDPRYYHLAKIASRRFSKAYYSEELEDFFDWLKITKTYSPLIYKQLLGHFFGSTSIPTVDNLLKIS